MNFPILRELIRLPDLPATPVPIGCVVPLDKARIDCSAHLRQHQCQYNCQGRAKDHSGAHSNDFIVLSLFMYSRICDLRWNLKIRLPRTPPPTRSWRFDHPPIRRSDRLLIWGMLVGGHQPHHPTARACPEILDQRMGRLRRPLSDHQTHNQSAFRVDRHMVPAIPQFLVVRFTVLFLLADERPFLIELSFARRRGKKPPTRRGVGGLGPQPFGCIW